MKSKQQLQRQVATPETKKNSKSAAFNIRAFFACADQAASQLYHISSDGLRRISEEMPRYNQILSGTTNQQQLSSLLVGAGGFYLYIIILQGLWKLGATLMMMPAAPRNF